MIREERVLGIDFDAGQDVLHLHIAESRALPPASGGLSGVDLLLDAAGYLVGVDLGGEGLARLVVMIGPHEAVTRTVPAQARIARSGGAVTAVTIQGAARAARGAEPNPYLR